MIAGVNPVRVEDYTMGELIDYVKSYNERKRREYKQESIIAFRQAQLIAGWVWKSNDIDISEAFPYWTEEEVKQIQVEKYKQRMFKAVNYSKAGN